MSGLYCDKHDEQIIYALLWWWFSDNYIHADRIALYAVNACKQWKCLCRHFSSGYRHLIRFFSEGPRDLLAREINICMALCLTPVVIHNASELRFFFLYFVKAVLVVDRIICNGAQRLILRLLCERPTASVQVMS